MILKYDKKYNFKSMFDPKTGFYARTGVLDKDGKDTNVDPFMASFPELLDVGVMQTCVCSNKCNVDCYQKARDRRGKNMSLEDFESLLKQSTGKCFQWALGGAGDVDTHENFKELLELCKKYKIVPNFTTSGILMNEEKAKLCKEYCGAVAVSQHSSLKSFVLAKEKASLRDGEENFNPYVEDERSFVELFNNGWKILKDLSNPSYCYKEVFVEDSDSYTYKAIRTLLDAGVKTSIHYVLGKKSIDEAIVRLKNNAFPKGINAVVFLLYKPVGLGKEENVLSVNDAKVKEFFNLVDTGKFNFKIGFDSCTAPGICNFSHEIMEESIDFCEGARFSAYIDANMNMMPCSFANQDSSWHMNLREYSIEEVWNSEIFDRFRHSLKNSCASCPSRNACGGGCPLVNQITLCNRKERNFEKGE